MSKTYTFTSTSMGAPNAKRIVSPPSVPMCQSGSDGECNWDDCPQLTDRKSYCPYAKAWEDYWEGQGYDNR